MRVDFCCPIYDSPSFETFMSFCNARNSLGDVYSVKGYPDIATARNLISTGILKSNSEYSLWCDSDIVFKSEHIDILLETMSYVEDLGIVSGICRSRRKPHHRCIFKYDEDNNAFIESEFKKESIFKIDACGAGFMLVKNKIFRDLGKNWWTRIDKFSEDLSFCIRAREIGYLIYAHPDVVCGHVMETILEGT